VLYRYSYDEHMRCYVICCARVFEDYILCMCQGLQLKHRLGAWVEDIGERRLQDAVPAGRGPRSATADFCCSGRMGTGPAADE
jgi:hypothetical protein